MRSAYFGMNDFLVLELELAVRLDLVHGLLRASRLPRGGMTSVLIVASYRNGGRMRVRGQWDRVGWWSGARSTAR